MISMPAAVSPPETSTSSSRMLLPNCLRPRRGASMAPRSLLDMGWELSVVSISTGDQKKCPIDARRDDLRAELSVVQGLDNSWRKLFRHSCKSSVCCRQRHKYILRWCETAPWPVAPSPA